ncbi:hypothetical protein BOSP111201_26890 [Bordetella sputigena]
MEAGWGFHRPAGGARPGNGGFSRARSGSRRTRRAGSCQTRFHPYVGRTLLAAARREYATHVPPAARTAGHRGQGHRAYAIRYGAGHGRQDRGGRRHTRQCHSGGARHARDKRSRDLRGVDPCGERRRRHLHAGEQCPARHARRTCLPAAEAKGRRQRRRDRVGRAGRRALHTRPRYAGSAAAGQWPGCGGRGRAGIAWRRRLHASASAGRHGRRDGGRDAGGIPGHLRRLRSSAAQGAGPARHRSRPGVRRNRAQAGTRNHRRKAAGRRHTARTRRQSGPHYA